MQNAIPRGVWSISAMKPLPAIEFNGIVEPGKAPSHPPNMNAFFTFSLHPYPQNIDALDASLRNLPGRFTGSEWLWISFLSD
jgi:hypothetical protein